ncbi:hypothetical protein Tco_1103990 [Tanacetum coccineum]
MSPHHSVKSLHLSLTFTRTSATLAMCDVHGAETRYAILLRGTASLPDLPKAVTAFNQAEWRLSEVWVFWVGHPDDGSNDDGIGGGDECADKAVHLARRSLAEGGDSEIRGDDDGVVMARSLSTSASGGRDMKA